MTTNPINRACISGNIDILRQTVAGGHKPDIYSLDYAINTKNIEIVKIVCGLGSPPTTSTLSRACQVGNETIVQYAMAAGAQPDAETLTHALNSRNRQIIHIVTSLQATPNNDSLLPAIQLGDYSCIADVASKVEDVSEQLKKISWVGILSKDATELAGNYAMTILIERGAVFPAVYPSRFNLIKVIAEKKLWSDKLIRANLATQADYELIQKLVEVTKAQKELGENSGHFSSGEYHRRFDGYSSQIQAIGATQAQFNQQPYPPSAGSVAAAMRVPATKSQSNDDCVIA